MNILNKKVIASSPTFLGEFLNRLEYEGKSPRTIDAYFLDIRMFLRFIMLHKKLIPGTTKFKDIDIRNLTIEDVKTVTEKDIYAFLSFTMHRNNDIDDNNKNYDADKKKIKTVPSTRARKVASIRSMFKYLYKTDKVIFHNIADDIKPPKIKSKVPIYLTLNQTINLLNNIKGTYAIRDFTIITLFVNCALRVSELANINIMDITERTLKVTGKGDKQRTIPLNEVSIAAINKYLCIRSGITNLKGDAIKALFISRQNNRIHTRTIQHLVKKHVNAADIQTEKISPHKLRHTAATILYQYSKMDIRSLQELLGHSDISTTEIYTHIEQEHIRKGVEDSPLNKL